MDVREEKEFLYNRALGAVSLSYLEYPERVDQFSRVTPLSTALFLYDAGGDVDISVRVAKRLLTRGYAQVSIVRGGILAWVRAGLPIETAFGTAADSTTSGGGT